MNIYEVKGLSKADRKATLEGEAFATRTQVYMKPLQPEEIADERTKFAQAAIDKAVKEDEFKGVKELHKDSIKPLVQQMRESMHAIKHGQMQTSGTVYDIQDFDNKMIHTLDEDGNVLGSRQMRPEERQIMITHQLQANS